MIMDKILVIKVGTSVLTRRTEEGYLRLDKSTFATIGRQITALRHQGTSVIVVSSAAIGAGMMATGITQRPDAAHEMPTLQALASIGWRHIMNAWSQALGDEAVGELLITRHELNLTDERRELLGVVEALLANGHTPIVNENDAISHEEIAFGDNDRLAVELACVLKRSKQFTHDISVVLLSDVDGVYTDVHDAATRIAHISDVALAKQYVRGVMSDGGTGGMASKFAAAQIAMNNSIDMYIADGRRDDAIMAALEGVAGTSFMSD